MRLPKIKDKKILSIHGAQSTLRYAREILELEALALQNVAKLINHDFDLALRLILSQPVSGRLITSGMGKASFIAMKVSATFASTGTPSFFLHPAEALHGDLGRFSKDDLALFFSNSGETPEIVKMLQPLKRQGCAVISITADSQSTLGKHSDIVIPTGKLEEAGPLGLAPTTSTTVMLALGDALAMAVLEKRGFTKEQFANFHPAGNLGRQLMLVQDIMRKGEQLAIARGDLIAREVLHIISSTRGRPGAACIVDLNGKLIGVFTDGDLRRCLEKNSAFLDAPICEVMGKSPKLIGPGKLVQEALHLMGEFKVDQLIVVDNCNVPIGMIDIQDIVEIKL